ncbi:MAG: branched-chain amino acid ABC transporter permease [Acidimicrobiia bacterium]|nr:branched-chain amino acid ABC transporter permease [Acidimicrobiia bacterium]
MSLFFEQLILGVATGCVYASLALALVLIYRSTRIVNFAQGEMAMFSTFIAWQFTQWGWPVWGAIGVTLVISFLGGCAIERVVIRPVEGSSILAIVIVTLGLLLIFNQAAGWVWDFVIKDFPDPFPTGEQRFGDVRISFAHVGTIVVLAVTVTLLYLLFQKTKIGLAMRAAAANPESSRLVGINVGRMLMLGWGLAAVLGALAGVIVAPRLFLDPNMMVGVQIYAFAAATLGGFDSPVGAVVGGIIVGVAENMAGTYIGFIGSDLKIAVPLIVIFGVLMVKPVGLFGRHVVARV